MNKCLFLVVLLVILTGCHETVKESIELEGFDTQAIQVSYDEETAYIINDILMPTYVRTVSKNQNLLSDWDESTSAQVKKEDVFEMHFEKKEVLAGIEITSEGVEAVRIVFSSGSEKIIQLNEDHTLMTFDPVLDAEFMTIQILDTYDLTGTISEVHAIKGVAVEESEFKAYHDKLKLVSDVQSAYEWQIGPQDNMVFVEDVIEKFSDDLIHYTILSDLSRINKYKDLFLGYPILIKGQVLTQLIEANHQILLIETHLTNKPIEVIVPLDFVVEASVTLPTIYIGSDTTLTFYALVEK